jgi:hypothetical protein
MSAGFNEPDVGDATASLAEDFRLLSRRKRSRCGSSMRRRLGRKPSLLRKPFLPRKLSLLSELSRDTAG